MASKNQSSDIAVPEAANSLATIGNYAIATMDGDRLRRTIQENIGTDRITPNDLDRVTMPGSGATMWTIPSMDGDIDTRELTGIIIHWHNARAYWPNSDTMGAPPQCWSNDAIYGHGDPGDHIPGNLCEACPMSAWGSDPKPGSKGQACKLMRPIFMVQEGGLLPIVVNLPPTSIQPCKKFFLRLASNGKTVTDVVTTITLHREQNDSGNPYSVADFKVAAVLTPEESDRVRTYAEQIRPALESVRIETPVDIHAAT